MFKFLKRKPKKETSSVDHLPPTIDNTQAIHHHKTRISNLQEEFEQVSSKIVLVESSDSSRNVKNKEVDLLIMRMSIIKYEIETREGLLQWLY